MGSSCQLDHLVIAADTLKTGVAYVEDKLGVRVGEGGKHPLMGTHNALMQLGSGAFLEIIAVDPEAQPPERPRWFGLDDPVICERIAAKPTLLTWVVRTTNIEQTIAQSPISPGTLEEGRRGQLVWKITISQDGSMPEHGLFPTLIEWPDGKGPASSMADPGCRLQSLHIVHDDPAHLRAALKAIGGEELAVVKASDAEQDSALHALIESPRGLVEIS